MNAYYNEFDPFAAAWLRELIKAGQIPDGEVDERSILDVRPDELKGFTQCHFFAGIGGWPLALRLAGWPDDRPVWTGSCPCQSFSSAGEGKGREDIRHLWPTWFDLISQRKPAIIFGEQVAAAVAFGWWDEVAHDLENQAFACAAAIIPACSVGSPHRRDRLWFVGHAASAGTPAQRAICSGQGNDTIGGSEGLTAQFVANSQGAECELTSETWGGRPSVAGYDSYVADTHDRSGPPQPQGCITDQREWPIHRSQGNPMVNSDCQRSQGCWPEGTEERWQDPECADVSNRAFWRSGEWVKCPDGKIRLIEPSIRLLAHGVSNRVGKLRGYGNAIIPQVAAQFIEAAREAIGG